MIYRLHGFMIKNHISNQHTEVFTKVKFDTKMKKTVLISCSVLFIGIAIFSFSSFQSLFEHGNISVGIVVSDMSVSEAFYKDVLGMQETAAFTLDGDFGKRSGLTGGKEAKIKILKLTNDPQASEWKLISIAGAKVHKKSQVIQDDNGMQYITLKVVSLNPFLEKIKAKKIPLLGETPITLAENTYFILIQDPDGNFIEIIGDM